MNGPFAILTELTYGCPLKCPYCSNPLNFGDYADGELSTSEWRQVLAEAAELGVLQVHLSGGEPLLRRDLAEIVAVASDLGLYTNLITSALGLTGKRAAALKHAGLDHVQISVQADEAVLADEIAGLPAFDRKVAAARLVKELGWPLTLNVVLHRRNLDRIAEIIDLAESLEADRVELANTQYYGWALHNRAALLPTRGQLERAEGIVRDASKRLGERMELIYVLPDYYEKYPKPCMGGWGRHQLTVAPNGRVLPCPTAYDVPLPRVNVREHSLRWIWEDSPLFTAYRGTDWLPSPCRTCARRDQDFGGCRCQAFALTGDAARTDPVCSLSPDHGIVLAARTAANGDPAPKGPSEMPGLRPRHLPKFHETGSRRRRPASLTDGP
jgi:PqqA peptide cyclase